MKKILFSVILIFSCVSICWAQFPNSTVSSSSISAKETPVGYWEKVFPEGLIDGSGKSVSVASLSGKIVGIYFSAHWCPPCRAFSPKLVEFRNANSKDFEVVFISWDKSEENQFGYMKELKMEWPAVRFGSEIGKDLEEKFHVSSIPALIINSPGGEILSEDGEGDVISSPATCLDIWKEKAGLTLKK